MAGIPLFPAGTNIGPNTAPRTVDIIGSLDPTAYIRGLEAAKLQPSITTSIIEGLKQGAEFEQRYRSNEGIIAANQANTQQTQLENQSYDRRIDAAIGLQGAQTREAQINANLAPQKLAVQEANAEIQASRVALDSKRLLLDTKKAQLQLQNDDQRISDQSALMDQFSKLSPETIDATTKGMEKNPSRIAGAAITIDKGKIVPDPTLSTEVINYPEKVAAVGGTPEQVARAQKVVDKFQRDIDTQQKIVAGQSLSPLPSSTAAPVEEPKKIQLQAPVRKQALTNYENEIVFPRPGPEYGLGVLPPAIDSASFKKLDDELPIEQRTSHITSESDIDYTARLAEKIYAESIAKGVPKNANLAGLKLQAEKLATDRVAKSVFTVAQTEKMASLSSVVTTSKRNLGDAVGALKTLEDLVENEGLKPTFGPTSTFETMFDSLKSQVGTTVPREKRAAVQTALDEIYGKLTGLGIQQVLSDVQAVGATFKIVDRLEEQKQLAATNFGADKSIATNIQALQKSAALLQRADDTLQILTYAQKRKLPYATALGLISTYNRDNPIFKDTKVTVRVPGTPENVVNIVGYNPAAEQLPVEDFINREMQ